MFWKKKIPAQQHERALLLHRLFHQRSENDSNAQVLAHFLGQSLDDIAPEELLVGTPESTILGSV